MRRSIVLGVPFRGGFPAEANTALSQLRGIFACVFVKKT